MLIVELMMAAIIILFDDLNDTPHKRFRNSVLQRLESLALDKSFLSD